MSLAKAHWLAWGIAASLAGVATTIIVNYVGKLLLFFFSVVRARGGLFYLFYYFFSIKLIKRAESPRRLYSQYKNLFCS